MEQNKVPIKPQGCVGKVADWLMQPVMYWMQNNWSELPQRTHFWNNQKFPAEELSWLNEFQMTFSAADPEASNAWISFLPIFHMPRFGGWKEYIVLQPVSPIDSWYVGWLTPTVYGVSRVTLSSSVKVTRGNTDCAYFGIDSEGYQIPLKEIGAGTIGDGRWADVPLL